MTIGRFREKFNQAAIGPDSDVLAHIGVPQYNLAVWKKAAEPLRQSAYIRDLDLETLGRGQRWRDGYFRALFEHSQPRDPAALRQSLKKLDAKLEEAGLPQGDPHTPVNRRVLADKMMDFLGHFSAAIGQPAGFSLLLFRPDPGMFWHTDAGPARGIVTLRGNDATLWRPDHTLPGGKPRDSVHWGAVFPNRQPYIQMLEPGDMAVFKCRGYENPLVHASPLCKEKRLVMIMGPR